MKIELVGYGYGGGHIMQYLAECEPMAALDDLP